MPQKSGGGALAMISKPALIMTESVKDHDALVSALQQALKPRDVIEDLFVADIAAIVSETLRYRRCKAALINTAFRDALRRLMIQFWKDANETASFQGCELLAFDWFTDPKAKRYVAEILGRFDLDETAIEAEAIRSLAPELEVLDRMLSSLEVRRERAIRGIAEYRKNFAERVREVSDRIIESGPILRLGKNIAGQRSA
jgi:hypothetical protein